MKSEDLRQSYIDYFVQLAHKHVPSSPLVPPDDPTLLFTTAGMVQFKPLYSGSVDLPYRRACSVQKCLRAGGKGSDLENVGRTLRHHTFFEMLGNFSFGDYFKREALVWAWEFSTEVLKLDKSRLFASVFEDDDQAWDIWTKEIGLPEDRMVRLGAKDNFWGPAGDTGACGPCSEIYYDRGEQYGPGLTFQHATINDDDPNTRYLEYWNNVFPQFDQQKDKTRLPLKNRGVDTGMGLERLACITQDKASPFQTDLMMPIVDNVCGLVGVRSYTDATMETRQAVNVIADHVRALTFALSEGILPSNEGRGYVLRRLLRRAGRYARKLGSERPFMYRVVESVIEKMAPVYPELLSMPDIVKKVVRLEEESYAQTLGSGLERLETLFGRVGGQVLPGSEVFMLSATYGLPFDEVREIASDRGFEVDLESYQAHVQQHREESRGRAKGAKFEAIYERLKELAQTRGRTEFLGHAPCTDAAGNGREEQQYPVATAQGLEVLAVFKSGEAVSRAVEGDEIEVVLDRCPFYAESGGQIGDSGTVRTDHAVVQVNDSQKTPEDVYVHYGVVLSGELRVGAVASAEIDAERRWSIMRNHTATHLLQGALKTVVGRHITQQGSYVGPDYLRFDFTNPEALTAEQLAEIERLVNEQIMRNVALETRVMSLEEARQTGAIAPFGEKYAQVVRVVNVPEWDIEFCGGTHMPATGGIGYFVIVGESAIASGVRRIEAVTGTRAVELVQAERTTLKHLGEELSVPRERVGERVTALLDEIKHLRKQLAQVKAKAAAEDAASLLESASETAGFKVIKHRFDGLSANELRGVYDSLKSKQQRGLLAVLASNEGGRVTIIVGATPDVVEKGISAAEIVKRIAPIVSGSGGGKKEMAQAGGKDVGKIDEALAAVDKLLHVGQPSGV